MLSLKEEITNWRREYFKTKTYFFVAQWLGYIDVSYDFFSKIPKEINVINMGYATITESGLSLDSLTRFISKDVLRKAIKNLQKQNIKVLLSITDHQDYQWYKCDTNSNTFNTFICNLLDILDDWGFDGIDIHNNSEITNKTFTETTLVNLIKNVRKSMSSDRLLTLSAVNDPKYNKIIIHNTSKYLDWINLVNEGSNPELLFNKYQAININVNLNVNNLNTLRYMEFIKDKKIGIYMWGINKDFKDNFSRTKYLLEKLHTTC